MVISASPLPAKEVAPPTTTSSKTENESPLNTVQTVTAAGTVGVGLGWALAKFPDWAEEIKNGGQRRAEKRDREGELFWTIHTYLIIL